MKKIKAFIKAFADTFVELAQKVETGNATGDEAMAYGCMYVIVAVFIFVVFIIAVLFCRLIWHLI